ncbi:MAG: SDR family NAD(P)-dependent oxidoreductase, partial [Gammaproteobacteria bacterium]|nr:SDR family NAD(P)-dependent oxidoreductase [Gammaproteobacteria bacterium]
MSLSQTVFITGASAGIGAGLAREYARRGARLALFARRTELLESLAA